MMELERYQIAEEEASKDFEYLYKVTTRNISSLSSQSDYENIKIDEKLFKQKYPKDNIRIAQERLARLTNFINITKNLEIKARTNYYVEPGTKKIKPYSNRGK